MATEVIIKEFVKDPSAVLDYKFDFAALTNGTGNTNWLASGETITAKTVTADAGLTVDSSSITDAGTSVTAFLSGGTDGENYQVVCHITTDNATPREDDRTILIKARNT